MVSSPILVSAAALAGAAIGAAAGWLARRCGAGSAGRAGPVLAGSLAAPAAVLVLPAQAWPPAACLALLLIAIAWLDLRAGIVHAALAGPLAALGLLEAAQRGALAGALAGAALGYGLCLLVEHAFRRLRGRDGLGRGDAWVLGAAGAWVGASGVGLVLALAAAGALLAALLRARPASATLPFAPAICAAAALTWTAAGGRAWAWP